MTLIEYLKTLRYPGRFIVVGKVGDAVLAVYGATGRSAASLARTYVMDEHKDVWAQHTDEVAVKEGNLELLEYRAVKWTDNGFVMANGRQIEGGWETCDPEPDAYHTPRITAVVTHNRTELFISRMSAGIERKRWELDLNDGAGYFISTYSGEDTRPTKSFASDPVKLEMHFDSTKSAAKEVFDALEPPKGESDYRVGVVGVSISPEGRGVAIYNKL